MTTHRGMNKYAVITLQLHVGIEPWVSAPEPPIILLIECNWNSVSIQVAVDKPSAVYTLN